MYIMSNPVFILSGIVWKNKDVWYIGNQDISNSLLDFFGKRVTVSLHHWPDENKNICFHRQFCHHHKDNPNFLFNFKEEIVFEDINQIPLQELEGHHGRIIFVWEDFEIPLPDMKDVEQGSKQLQELLKSLQETLKEMK